MFGALSRGYAACAPNGCRPRCSRAQGLPTEERLDLDRDGNSTVSLPAWEARGQKENGSLLAACPPRWTVFHS